MVVLMRALEKTEQNCSIGSRFNVLLASANLCRKAKSRSFIGNVSSCEERFKLTLAMPAGKAQMHYLLHYDMLEWYLMAERHFHSPTHT